jgi:hypothetical protein
MRAIQRAVALAFLTLVVWQIAACNADHGSDCAHGGCDGWAPSCETCTLYAAETACGVDGQCLIDACLAAHLDCDSVATNGCEINGAHDEEHCGACGMACAAGETCVKGRCGTFGSAGAAGAAGSAGAGS